jgi:hypothetical protein
MMRLWAFLFALAGALALWFSGMALYEVWGYCRLAARAPGTVEHWEVVERSSSSFAIRASYLFRVCGQERRGETLFREPYYLNPMSAACAVEQLQSRPWEVWFCPKDPSLSSLQRFFPWKKVIHALIVTGVACYFFFLKDYAVRLSRTN